MSNSPFTGLEFLYETTEDRTAFGPHWIGPDRMDHNVWTPVGKFEKEHDTDGKTVIVEGVYCPAQFYRIIVEDDETGAKFKLSTGSGWQMRDIMIQLAKAMTIGMFVVRPYTTERRPPACNPTQEREQEKHS